MRRWFQEIRRKISYRSGGLILMYHRTIDIPLDPWQLAVSPKNFEDQLQVLKDTGLVIPLTNMIEQLKARGEIKNSIAITFDDGYEDNFLNAKPLLEKYELPASFFICTKHIGQKKDFWWDELAALVLTCPELPKIIKLDFPDSKFNFNLKEGNFLTEEIIQLHKNWNANIPPPTQRALLFIKLWKAMSILSYENQQAVLNSLKESVNYNENLARGENYCMSEEQLISMANNTLFTIGAHTETHPLMSGLSGELQQEEIKRSKQYLERVTRQKQDLFAYPHGNFNELTIDILKDQDIKVAVTTYGKVVRKNEDPYQLGRFQIINWGKLEFAQKLKMWL